MRTDKLTAMRKRGEGGLFKIKGSSNWYISWKRKRIATGTPIKAIALQKLNERAGAVSLGFQTSDDLRRLRYEQVRDSLLSEYRHKGKALILRSNGTEDVLGLKHLNAFFGGQSVAAITTDRLRDFVAKRKGEGAASGTINRNLSLLRRMLNLARQENKLHVVPHFPMLEEAPPRTGFVDDRQFKKLFGALPSHLKPFALFLYTTGCRSGEAATIKWSQTHLAERVIRLEGKQTKGKKPRTIPLVDLLVQMLKREKDRSGLLFPVGDFRKAWSTACVKVGLGTRVKGKKNGGYGTYTGLIPHDLRRSAVRNMIRAGVSQSVAMSISGHKTIATFMRYDITAAQDQHAAMNRIESSLSQVIKAPKRLKGANAANKRLTKTGL
jgi:integrase